MNLKQFTCSTLIVPVFLVGCSVATKPLSFTKNAVLSEQKLNDTIESQESITGPINLYEAMARALKYNLDYQIELMQESLKLAQLDFKQFDMLPAATINSGYSRRNEYAGGTSRSLITGRQSLEPSTSSDRGIITTDYTLSWDVLDFGLSYARAQQIGEEVMIAREAKRKVINRIIESVRTTYWRAVGAERTLSKLVKLENEAVQALKDSAEMEKRRIVSPGILLNYQRDLLQIQTEVQRLQRELAMSKTQLAALMNIRPDAQFELVIPDRSDAIPVLPGSVDDMLLVALAYRPELRETELKIRSLEHEKTIALLQSLPSLKVLTGLNFDSNSMLYSNDWLSISSRISFNLINLFKYPAYKRMLTKQEEALKQQNLAMSMAIMTQVYVARLRFIRFSHELGVANQSQAVQEKLVNLARSSYAARAISQQMMVREEMSALLSQIRYDISYADMQNSFASLYASMGLDNYDEDFNVNADIDTLTSQLHAHWINAATVLPVIER